MQTNQRKQKNSPFSHKNSRTQNKQWNQYLGHCSARQSLEERKESKWWQLRRWKWMATTPASLGEYVSTSFSCTWRCQLRGEWSMIRPKGVIICIDWKQRRRHRLKKSASASLEEIHVGIAWTYQRRNQYRLKATVSVEKRVKVGSNEGVASEESQTKLGLEQEKKCSKVTNWIFCIVLYFFLFY